MLSFDVVSENENTDELMATLFIVRLAINQKLREALEGDFLTANAWQLDLQDDGKVYWVAEDHTLESQPATSFMQRIEDWFVSHLPIEGEL